MIYGNLFLIIINNYRKSSVLRQMLTRLKSLCDQHVDGFKLEGRDVIVGWDPVGSNLRDVVLIQDPT